MQPHRRKRSSSDQRTRSDSVGDDRAGAIKAVSLLQAFGTCYTFRESMPKRPRTPPAPPTSVQLGLFGLAWRLQLQPDQAPSRRRHWRNVGESEHVRMEHGRQSKAQPDRWHYFDQGSDRGRAGAHPGQQLGVAHARHHTVEPVGQLLGRLGRDRLERSDLHLIVLDPDVLQRVLQRVRRGFGRHLRASSPWRTRPHPLENPGQAPRRVVGRRGADLGRLSTVGRGRWVRGRLGNAGSGKANVGWMPGIRSPNLGWEGPINSG